MSDKTLTREQLEDQADAAQLEAEELERQMSAARESFQSDLLAGGAVDAVAFQQRQNESAMLLAQMKLKAARSQLALLEHDARLAAADRDAAYEAVRDAEQVSRDAEKALQAARAHFGKVSSGVEGYNHRRGVLTGEIQRLSSALLNAVDGKVSALRPPPQVIRG